MVAAGRNARLGMKLFLVYLAVYVGYVAIVAFRPDLMRMLLPGGVNLAVAYGFGLIVLALLMALAYGWLCRIIAPTDGKGGK